MPDSPVGDLRSRLSALHVAQGLLPIRRSQVPADLLAGVTLPAWYWAPRGSDMAGYVHGTQLQHGVPIGYFPHGANGPGAIGLFADSLPRALIAAAVFAVLFALFSYVLVATARMHARVARSLLGPPVDPLEDARGVMTGPGPLGTLIDH